MTQRPSDTADLPTQRSELHREILTTILRRDRAVEQATAPAAHQHWETEAHKTMKAHGAKYTTGLFGVRMPERIRARYRRAFRELVEAGLVIPYREFAGGRITHAKLSPAGTVEAERIAGKTSSKDETHK